MADELTAILARFQLNEGENAPLLIPIEAKTEDRENHKWCLIGELISQKKYNRNAFKKTMMMAWNCKDGIRFMELEENVYQISFSSAQTMLFVLNQGPWLFEDNLFVLARWDGKFKTRGDLLSVCQFWIQLHDLPFDCRGRNVTSLLGARVGKVVREETHSAGEGVTQCRFIRLKVEVNIKKPLIRGLIIESDGRKKWIWIKYERLPKFCSYCGIIGHEALSCEAKSIAESNGDMNSEVLYGDWIRAGSQKSPLYNKASQSNPQKRSNSDHQPEVENDLTGETARTHPDKENEELQAKIIMEKARLTDNFLVSNFHAESSMMGEKSGICLPLITETMEVEDLEESIRKVVQTGLLADLVDIPIDQATEDANIERQHIEVLHGPSAQQRTIGKRANSRAVKRSKGPNFKKSNMVKSSRAFLQGKRNLESYDLIASLGLSQQAGKKLKQTLDIEAGSNVQAQETLVDGSLVQQP